MLITTIHEFFGGIRNFKIKELVRIFISVNKIEVMKLLVTILIVPNIRLLILSSSLMN